MDAIGDGIHSSVITKRAARYLPVVWIIVAPGPVDGLLPGAELDESSILVVLSLVSLVRAGFIVVPPVIVLVVLVIVAPVVVVVSVSVVLVVLRDGSGHRRNWHDKGSSQEE